MASTSAMRSALACSIRRVSSHSRLYAAMIRLISSWISACRVDLFSHEGLMGMSSSGTPSQLLMLSTTHWTAARRPSRSRRSKSLTCVSSAARASTMRAISALTSASNPSSGPAIRRLMSFRALSIRSLSLFSPAISFLMAGTSASCTSSPAYWARTVSNSVDTASLSHVMTNGVAVTFRSSRASPAGCSCAGGRASRISAVCAIFYPIGFA